MANAKMDMRKQFIYSRQGTCLSSTTAYGWLYDMSIQLNYRNAVVRM
jgi:hypothetical protein